MRQRLPILSLLFFASCATGSFKSNEGLYIRGGFSHVAQQGDFDGETALIGATQAVVIPNVDEGTGFEAAVGVRGQGAGLEFAYSSTASEGSLLGVPGFDFERQTFDMNFRFNFLDRGQVRPYFMVGVGYMQGEIDNGTLIGTSLSTADLSGFSLPVGLGVETFLTPYLSVDVRAVQRFGSYGSANGIEIDDNLDGDSFEITAGLALTF